MSEATATTTATTTDGTQAAAAAAAPAAAAQTTQQPGTQANGQPIGTTQPIVLNKEFSDWATNKGIKDLKIFSDSPEHYKFAQAYRDTESMVGKLSNEKLVLPKDFASEEGKLAMQDIYNKLGRPGASTDYKIEIPEGGDSAFALKFGEAAHKAGFSQQQVSDISGWWNNHVAEFVKESGVTSERETAVALDALDKEWGNDIKINSEVATRGLSALGQAIGWDANRIEAVRNGGSVTLNAAEALKVFKAYGDIAKVTNDTFEGGERGVNNAGAYDMTPVQAEQKRQTLIKDREFQARLKRGDASAKSEWDKVHKIAASGKQA